MDKKLFRFDIGSIVQYKGTGIGKVNGISVNIGYELENEEIRFYVIDEYKIGKNRTIERKINKKAILRDSIPEYKKYFENPIEGCVFIENNERWIIEEVIKNERGDGGGRMGESSNSWIEIKYSIRNLNTGEVKIIDKFDKDGSRSFEVIEIKKKVFK